MSYNDIKISLTIELEGSALVSKGISNAEFINYVITEKDINPNHKGKVNKVVEKGRRVHIPKVNTKIRQTLNMSESSYNYFVSEDSTPHGMEQRHWERLPKKERLKIHMNITAQALGGTILSYEVLN